MKERKVILFIVSVVCLGTALLLGKATGTEFYLGTIALYTAFVVGNIGEHASNKKR